jgi:cysteine desulfurase/selenocysteine lyase
MAFFGIDGTVRPSYAFYNTFEEIDQLADALVKIKVMFG